MTVKITKSEINIREKLAELDGKQDKLIQRPAFSCNSSGTYTTTTSEQNISTFIQSNEVGLNIGGHLVNGKFTAPIDGLYHFDLKAAATYNSGYHYHYMYQTSNSATLSFTIYAKAGDYFEPYVNTNYAGGSVSACLYSGHYIG
jgi:hypothetical protein